MTQLPIRSIAARRKHEAGYNLIEVLLAIAIMGAVLVSIAGLFFYGRSNVYSGKEMTQAVAVGTHAIEDLSTMSIADVYSNFVIGSTSSLGNYTIDGVAYNNALLRSTDPNIVASAPSDISSELAATTYLTKWNNEIVNNRKMAKGSVTLVISPRIPTQIMNGTAAAPAVLQLRVIVRWVEATRQRHAVFDTVRSAR